MAGTSIIDKALSNLTDNQVFMVFFTFILLLGTIAMGAYSYAKSQSEITCFSCLGLYPEAGEFEDWWTKYPDGHVNAGEKVNHPFWIDDDLESHNAVMLFFSTPSCSGCDQQWEDMSDAGLVSGSKLDGELTKFNEFVKFYTLDANVEKNYNTLKVYDPEGRNYGVPVTVFLTNMKSGQIGWYSYKGPLPAGDVAAILEIAIHHNVQ